MGEKNGEMTKHSTPKDPQEESPGVPLRQQQPPPPQQLQQQQDFCSTHVSVSPLSIVTIPTAPPYISTPSSLFATRESGDQSEPNPKRPRYGSSGQWKLLPSPTATTVASPQPSYQHQSGSSPSPTTQPSPANLQQQQHLATADSSSPTPSSPSHSPRPSFSAASGQDPTKSERFLQLRKGKYVSPVWKPNEMLWLARAWRFQFCGEGSTQDPSITIVSSSSSSSPMVRGKSRAEKDKEVAEFLQSHGVNRDAKTAGTKWDNMLGEFRKVYEWERGSEKEQLGKSYFRLSPYERKMHRLPASFDEEVYQELSQFMGFRVRSSQNKVTGATNPRVGAESSQDPEMLKHEARDDLPVLKQQATVTGSEAFMVGMHRGTLLESDTPFWRELRRIGKIRMTWEESVSLWAEEGEYQRGRLRFEGLNFLNADELTFLDENMAANSIETFEDGPLRGFSVDRFICGQQLKVFGRCKHSGFSDRVRQQPVETLFRSVEFQDRSDYFLGCLRVPTSTLPSLLELSWYIQEPPPEEYRFPLRREVYKDLPPGKDLFFTPSELDCRSITYDIVAPLIRSIPNPIGSRDSFIPIWDDCINRIITKFCPLEMVLIRKPTSYPSSERESIQDQWPNVTAFIKNLCLWRGEETDGTGEAGLDPSSSIVEKLLWTYGDIPYLFGYHAVGFIVTFCALSRSSHDRILRTDLYTVDLSTQTERLKALVPCWRIATLLPLLADQFSKPPNTGVKQQQQQQACSDFERVDLGSSGQFMEYTPNTVKVVFPNRRKWASVKEIYDFLDHRIPHAEYVFRAVEKELCLVFKPRGRKTKPSNAEQLVEALKFVTKALVALHDLGFMHRNLNSWEKVMKRMDKEEWFIVDFEEAVGAPQIYPHIISSSSSSYHHRCAPEMARGVHGVKVDVWGVGHLIRSCGINGVPQPLRDLQNRCLEHNPEQRPTAADCYHHLLSSVGSSSY